MAKPLFDAMVKNGSYKDRDGNEKARWLKIGTVFEGDKGLSMILDCVPVGVVAPVWVSFFQVKEKGQQAAQSQQSNDPYSESVPF